MGCTASPNLSRSSNHSSDCSSSTSNSSSMFKAIVVQRGDRFRSDSSAYTVEEVIGEGTFGCVVKCVKSATNESVAVKIAKTVNPPEDECIILRKLQPYQEFFIRFETSFIYEGCFFQEFELLDITLLDLLGKRPKLKLPEIRRILQQVASALKILKDMGIVHADLKPDNIMMVDHVKKPLQLKLIDFSCASRLSRPAQTWGVQNLFFRAPEVILGCPYHVAIDMWSLGCIAARMFLGFKLYSGMNEYEMLWQMTNSNGPFPQEMLQQGVFTRYFYKRKSQKWKLMSPQYFGPKLSVFNVYLLVSPNTLPEQTSPEEMSDTEAFVDLLHRMLAIDPDQRIHPAHVLEHPFIKMSQMMASFGGSSHVQESALSLNNVSCDNPAKRKFCFKRKRSPKNTEEKKETQHNSGTCKDGFNCSPKGLPTNTEEEYFTAKSVLQVTSQENSRCSRNISEFSRKRKRSPSNTEEKNHTPSTESWHKHRKVSEVSPKTKIIQMVVKETVGNWLDNICEEQVSNTEFSRKRKRESTDTEEENNTATDVSEASPRRKRMRMLTNTKKVDLTLKLSLQVTSEENSRCSRNTAEFSRKRSSTNTVEKNDTPSTEPSNNVSEDMQRRKRTRVARTTEEECLSQKLQVISQEKSRCFRNTAEFSRKRKRSPSNTEEKNLTESRHKPEPSINVSEDMPRRKRMRMATNTHEECLSQMLQVLSQENISEFSSNRKSSPANIKILSASKDSATTVPQDHRPASVVEEKNLTTVPGAQDTPQERTGLVRNTSCNVMEDNPHVLKLCSPGNTLFVEGKKITVPEKKSEGTEVTTKAEERVQTGDPPISKTDPLIQHSQSDSSFRSDNRAKVWIIGCGHIVRGKAAARELFGENFGLNIKVEWFGREGMRWADVLPFFEEQVSMLAPPDILVIHAGSNNLGLMPYSDLGLLIKNDLELIHEVFPSTKIVYSGMTDRNQWNGMPPRVNIDRRNINQRMVRVSDGFNGEVIEHRELKGHNRELFLSDGVHLSREGNKIFLTKIRDVITKILDRQRNVFL